MYVCTHVYIHITNYKDYIFINKDYYLYIFMYMYTYVHTCMYICIRVHKYIFMYTYAYVHTLYKYIVKTVHLLNFSNEKSFQYIVGNDHLLTNVFILCVF